MKEQTTLLFFQNKLSGYSDNASDIFGLDIAKYTNAKLEDMFSNETVLHIKSLPFGTTKEKIGFIGGVILDAQVIKSQIADYTILIMEFNASKALNPFGRTETATIFESILGKYLPSIEEKTDSLSTSKNKKAIISLKSEIFSLVSKVVSLVSDSKNNDILNAPENFCYVDIWEFLREIEPEINSLGNVSLDPIPYSSYFTYIKRENARNLILGILTYYIAQEQRPYIGFLKDGDNIIIRIANFPLKKAISIENKIIFCPEDIKATINFQKHASDCHIGFKRYVFTDNNNEFMLTFTPRVFEAIKEI